MADSRAINRAGWDERAPAHAASPSYALDRFLADPAFLSEAVRFDRPRLGEVAGLEAVHLQCHIGTDTVSLARLGARMSGLDFSPASIEQARRLAAASGTEATFVVADLYDAVRELGADRFDLVYTGVGALCWLPEIAGWARTVAGLLRPGGRLFMREGHPMLWTLDDARRDGLLVVERPYFETPTPLVEFGAGTYVETDSVFETTEWHEWNHGLGEIVGALLAAGMELTGLEEHDSAPWDVLPGMTEPLARGEFRLRERRERPPLTYTLQARRRS